MKLTQEQRLAVEAAKARGEHRIVLTPTLEQVSDWQKAVAIAEHERAELVRRLEQMPEHQTQSLAQKARRVLNHDGHDEDWQAAQDVARALLQVLGR
jgi:hypothetical protein